MASNRYVAVDLGASSGRVILGEVETTIRLSEVHRFPNPQILSCGHYQWDLLGLFQEIKKGLSLISDSGIKEVASIGVDTWGVDFGLVGRDDVVLGNPYCYRDARAQGMIDRAARQLPLADIYAMTGIQFMELNSIFQLKSMVDSHHPLLDGAETLLFMPDLFHFLLTGNRCSEYTIASTSQLLNARTRTWAEDLFTALGLPLSLMADIIRPGSFVGELRSEVEEETGLHIDRVVAPASHDTASAVAAVPAEAGSSWAYLSSGTWSLLGVERETPLINEETLERNFTNEGGVDDTIRFLKNATGMWILEECRRQWGAQASYQDLLGQAQASPPFESLIFPDDPVFHHPTDMPGAIQSFCSRTGQPVPASHGQFARCILQSLALRYRQILEDIGKLQSRSIEVLHVVGGGSQNELLNQFTADAAGIPVLAGPVEATALGNLMAQAIAAGQLDSFASGRKLIADSFPVRAYYPVDPGPWSDAYARFQGLCAAD